MECKQYLLSEMPIAVRGGRIPAVSIGITIRFHKAEMRKFIAAKSRMRGQTKWTY